MKVNDTFYFDYQASTPVDPRVVEAMKPFYNINFANPHSSDHRLGWEAAQAVDVSLTEIANLLSVDSDELVFTSGATESNNLALLGLARGNRENKRKRILVSAVEHKSVLEVARYLHLNEGFSVDYIPINHQGFIDLNFIEKHSNDDVLFASVAPVNNEIGTIQNIEKISEILQKHDIILHCDSAQVPCAISSKELAVFADMISLSSHKIYGPKGIGILYIERSIQSKIKPLLLGGGQQNDIRPGTVPVPLCVGMGKAASIILSEEGIVERENVKNLRNYMFKLLTESIPQIQLNGPSFDFRHPGNLNVLFNDIDASDLLLSLQPFIAASTGSACTSGFQGQSHVLRSIGLTEEEASSSIRFSLGRWTEEEHLEKSTELICHALSQIKN